MFAAPSPSASRGDVVLQPNYFTSSVYVKALRDDISTLILRYHEAYSQSGSTKPFALFKTIWMNMGWNWLQFKVFDHRSRQTFLEVTTRLIIERTVKTEAPFTRIVALFGAYIFFYTQIRNATPPLQSIGNIPIPCDHYLALTTMPECLATPHLLPLQPHARYVLSCFLKDRVFLILPKSELGPMNPRELPRELYADDGMVFSEVAAQKRKGRPARREKGKKARQALEELEEWVSKPGSNGTGEDLAEYQAVKSSMMHGLSEDGRIRPGSIESASEVVLARLREARERVSEDDDAVGIGRIEQAAGILGLLT